MTSAIGAHRLAVRRDRLALAALLLLMTVCAWLLQHVGGWPHLPATWPSWRAVGITLQGSYVPDDVVLYLITSAAWLLWLYVAFCVVLNAVLVLAERLGPGGPWLEIMRAVATRATLPIIRRTVEAAFVATFLINVGTRSAPLALAASPSPVATAVAPASGNGGDLASDSAQPESAGVEYTVQPADTLWSIASRFYGSGSEYPRLVQANTDRSMPDGRTFTAAGVIHPGWKLRIPLPSPAIDESGGQVRYVVQPGDCLSDIAARLLGDEDRWQELYSANRNVARLPDGRVLTSPDLVQIEPVQAAPSAASVPSSTSASSPEPTVAEVQPAPPATAGNRPPLTVLYGLAGGLAAASGGAAVTLVRRRRARRSLDEPLPLPEEDLPPVVSGFAEAELSRELSHRLAGDELEPPIVIAGQVARFLGGRGLDDVQVIAVRYAGERASVLLQCSLRDHQKLERTLPDLQRVFQCAAELKPTVDRDVLLGLRRLKLAKIVSLGWEAAASPLLIPVALLPQRETLYVEWAKAGPALLAGANATDVETVFVSLLTGLAARRSPDQLCIVTIGSPQTLPAPFAELPHLPRGIVDQADGDAVRRAVNEIKDVLLARIDAPAEGLTAGPTMVLAIAELAQLESSLRPAIETLSMEGAAHGVLLLAASGRPDEIDASLISEFRTQLVLRTLDEDQSNRVLGQPDAADLGGGGDLYVRVNGRTAMRGRGFRVTLEHLEELRRLMSEMPAPPAHSALLQDESALAGTSQADEPPERVDVESDPASEVESATEPERMAEPVASVLPETSTDEPGDDAEPVVIRSELAPPDPAEHDALRSGELLVHEDVEPGEPDEALEQQPLPDADLALAGDGMSSREGVAHVSARIAQRMGQPANTGAHGRGTSPAVLEVHCLGEFSVTYGGKRVYPQAAGVRHHQSWEILAMVAAQPNGMIAKEKVAAVMWPEATPLEVKNRLNQALRRLRIMIREQAPEAEGEFVRIVAPGFCRLEADVSCDVQQFVELCHTASRSADVHEAKHAAVLARALYGGDLLADMPYAWLHERAAGLSLQEHYRQDFCALTAELARRFMEEEQPQLAVPLYKELLVREPTLEDVIRHLYRCYAAAGNRAALVQEHRHLQEVLTEMFNGDPLAKPQPETIAAYQEALDSLRAQAAANTELAATA